MVGMDPEVSRYFKKIISSFSMGLLWLFSAATFGLYFQLGFVSAGVHWYNLLFYLLGLLSFLRLIFYYRKLWKNG